MPELTADKLQQAAPLVAGSGADVWITFDRETVDGGDPVLPLIFEGGLTWQSALIVARDGRRVAIVGNYDADLLTSTGDWHEVVPYVQSIRQPLLDALDRLIPASSARPRIAVNFSKNDVKADGLSHGMFLLLEDYFEGTRFEGCLESDEEIVMRLRARKTTQEIARMRSAIEETDRLFRLIGSQVWLGMSERDVYHLVQRDIDSNGLGYAWDRSADPIVNSGPESAVGHTMPSPDIRIAPGHILHIDLGVVKDGYSSDMQRCWYVPESGPMVPTDVVKAMQAVSGAISAGAGVLRPGVEGWQVDAAAREFITAAGYPEYLHALGHQVGRIAHDGGGILGPRWERYGNTPFLPVERDQVYTLELGVAVEGRGFLGIEEMVLVNESGCEFLTKRQMEMMILGQD